MWLLNTYVADFVPFHSTLSNDGGFGSQVSGKSWGYLKIGRSAGQKTPGVIRRHRFSVPRTRHDDSITLMHVSPGPGAAFPTRAILLGNTLRRDLAKIDARL
jgi:hypothetical protein